MSPSISRVDDLVLQALSLSSSQRADFLARECADDNELRAEVEHLLTVQTSSLRRADRSVFELISSTTDDSPKSLGPYDLEAKLGEGGTSAIFRGRRADGSDSRPVAIKLLKRGMDSQEILRRFQREGDILSALRHPHIARVFGGGISSDHRPYLVMELIEGEPIDRYCDSRQWSVEQRLRLLMSACAAIAYAHRNLVVHRDLKPDNILVTEEGVIKILDFGISKLLDPFSHRPATVTVTGHRMMTPEYAAPEQLAMAEISTAVDVYSLGVVLYELLTGRRPFERGEDPLHFLRRVLEEEPAAPSRHRSQLTPDVDEIVLKTLRKEPGQRYLSVEDLERDLANFLANRPVLARRGGLAYRLSKLARRRSRELVTGALLLLALAAALINREISRNRLEVERDKAIAAQDFVTGLMVDSDPYTQHVDGAPTFEHLLERGLEEIRQREDVPELKATLLKGLSRLYGNRGQHKESLAMIEEATELYRSSLPASDPRIATTETLLGDVLMFSGKLEEGEIVLRQALRRFDAQNPPDETARAATKVSLARALDAQAKYAEAETLYRQALAFLDELTEPDDAQRSLHVEASMLLGGKFFRQKEADQAIPHLDTAWKKATGEWGAMDARSISTRDLLAKALFLAGKRQEAITHMEAVVAGARETLGPHVNLGSSLLELGRWLHLAGEAGRAREALLEAHEVFLAAPGDNEEKARECDRELNALEILRD